MRNVCVIPNAMKRASSAWDDYETHIRVRNWWKKLKNHESNSMAHAENFHGGVSFSGIWWSFVFGVRCLWRHNWTSFSCFQANVFAKFVDTLFIFFCTHSP